MLSNHWFDNAGNKQGKNEKSSPQKDTEKETKFEKNPEMLCAKMEGKCYFCGKG